MKAWEQAPLLETLKVLADESRLKILWLVNEREYNVGELAEQVELTEPTVSHHLAKLHGVGLVNLRMDGNRRYYRLNKGGLNRFKTVVANLEQLEPEAETDHRDYAWIESLAAEQGWDEADQKVLREHTVNGKLTKIPARQKKQLVVLRWLATLFEADRLYTEKEVNAVIKSVHASDIAGLRRDLVDFGYLRRERNGGQYWLAPADNADAPSATASGQHPDA